MYIAYSVLQSPAARHLHHRPLLWTVLSLWAQWGKCQSIVSLSRYLTEWLRWEGASGPIWSNPCSSCGPRWTGCPGPCPGDFGRSPKTGDSTTSLQPVSAFWCCALMISSVCSPFRLIISWGLIQYLYGVLWHAAYTVCTKADKFSFLFSLPCVMGMVSPELPLVANLNSHLS